jgi:DNA gyrase subunit A
VGVKATTLNEDDDVEKLLITTTHTDLLIFTNFGKVYRIRAHQLPSGSRIAKGMPVINVIDIDKSETISSIINIDDYENKFLFFVTKKGTVKRTKLDEFKLINKNGKRAITLEEGDSLLNVLVSEGTGQIIIGASNGHIVRFDESNIRPSGRSAQGVIGIRMGEGDEVIGASYSQAIDPEECILTIGANGVGKMSVREDFRKT